MAPPRDRFSSSHPPARRRLLRSSAAGLPATTSPPASPSARRPDTRQAQLIRSYTSLLRSAPLMLFFQHNNLTAVEWMAVRRELKVALSAVGPTTLGNNTAQVDLAPHVRLEVLRARMFNVALKINEFFDPAEAAADPETQRTDKHGALVHDLSLAAYRSVKRAEEQGIASANPDSTYAQLSPLMTGPVAALIFPAVSPPHLAAALSILSPTPGQFPAPLRKKSPGYHEPVVQAALAKLLLVGGRVEGKVFDVDGVKWVGGIEGGLDGLRARLVAMLQGVGLGVTNTLESGSKSLWLSLEGRKMQLEDEQKCEAKKDE
ncbi:hypothetical protein jhhlp_006754 [Lomentospora prolificans]|uniref:Ribosomal protein YmL11, mitochondrial n=1 Tax=Lomentospora prolificans TaxID=41688 RepID=A0A2N3N2N1_9PEZI|nr:hypothetical protein jhhlp_006754 [Lomentospora prolificans]